ncbi:hypothetical protein N9971_00225 [bacterium]|nr:hypothetical protein [bacterium]
MVPVELFSPTVDSIEALIHSKKDLAEDLGEPLDLCGEAHTFPTGVSRFHLLDWFAQGHHAFTRWLFGDSTCSNVSRFIGERSDALAVARLGPVFWVRQPPCIESTQLHDPCQA